jgi:hypothetical protein
LDNCIRFLFAHIKFYKKERKTERKLLKEQIAFQVKKKTIMKVKNNGNKMTKGGSKTLTSKRYTTLE